MKLFAVYLGGNIKGANLEVHDIVFVIGNTIQDTYETLKIKWFGNKDTLHIDSVIELNHIDNYQISLTKEKPNNNNKLWFVNIGYAKNNIFGEQHNFHFIISDSYDSAKQKAKELFKHTPISVHLDNLIDIDSIFPIDFVDEYFIQIQKTDTSKPLQINNTYIPLK